MTGSAPRARRSDAPIFTHLRCFVPASVFALLACFPLACLAAWLLARLDAPLPLLFPAGMCCVCVSGLLCGFLAAHVSVKNGCKAFPNVLASGALFALFLLIGSLFFRTEEEASALSRMLPLLLALASPFPGAWGFLSRKPNRKKALKKLTKRCR